MVSQFEHLKLPRIINIELPRRPGRGFGGEKRGDFIEHGKHLLDQLSGLTEPKKQNSNPFRLDPKLIFKIKTTQKLSDDLVNQTGLDILAFEPDKAIVVFSSDLELKEFRRRLENYSQIIEGNKYDYLDAIDELVPLEREDRIGRLLELKPVQLGELVALDLELWHTGDRKEMKASLEHIAETLEFFSDTVPMRMSDNYVGEYLCIARIKVTYEVLEFLLELETVKEIDRPPQPAFERTADYNLPISSFPEVISPPEENCGILVIDSGVQSGHPLIAPVLGEADVFSDPGQQLIKGGTEDVNGHGTSVAGIAIYGDVENCIKKLSFDPTAWLFSARVTDENCKYYEDLLLETQIDQAIESFVDNYPNCKVINISLGDYEKFYIDGMKQFRLAAKIDEIAYQYQNKNIIFVISAGNSYHEDLEYEQLRTDYPNYLLNKNARIIDPATSAIALTVGSVSYGRGSMTEPADVRRQAIAKLRGYPSPFTRTGFGVDGMIKPDIVDFGGDLALDLSYREGLDLPKVSQLGDNVAGVSVVTFSKNFQSSLFHICSGTSFAAPRVANIAAQLFTKYPNASSNLIRALIVNSAVLPKEIPDEFQLNSQQSQGEKTKQIEKQLAIYGYGQTDLERAMYSAENYVVLSEDNVLIPVGKFHIYEIPQLPQEFFDVKGTRTLSITLAFDPPTRPTRGDSYLGVTMGFNIFKGIDRQSVINAYVDANKTEKPGDFAEISMENLKKQHGSGISIDLSPGSSLRKKGTVQRGQVQIFPQSTKYNEGNMILVVSCNRKWANADEIPRQRYALVVSISHSDSQVNLYNRVKLKVDEIDKMDQIEQRERNRTRF
jgi:hypothetical protein